MRIEEIQNIMNESARTNQTIQTLCVELLSLHKINDRMAGDIAELVRENQILRERENFDEPELPEYLGDLTEFDAPTEVNTQVYGRCSK